MTNLYDYDINNSGFNVLTINTLTSKNPSIEVLKDINMNGHNISNFSTDLDTLTVNNITSNNSQINVLKSLKIPISSSYLNMGSSGGGVGSRRISVYETGAGSDFRYNGFYIGSSIFGTELDINNNLLVSMATSSNTKYDSTTILGNGGIVLNNINSTPSNPLSGCVLYSEGNALNIKNPSGTIIPINQGIPKTIRYFISTNQSTNTVVSNLLDYFSLKCPNIGPINIVGSGGVVFFSSIGTLNNEINIQYNGSVAANILINFIFTLISVGTTSRLEITIWKNATFTGDKITGGTIVSTMESITDSVGSNPINLSVCVGDNNAANGSSYCVGVRIIAGAPADVICKHLNINATAY